MRRVRCIACDAVIKKLSGYYNSLDGAICKPCKDIVDKVEQRIRTERQEKKFLRFLESDYHLSIFLDDEEDDDNE